MEKTKIDQFLMINGKNFPEIMISQIKTKLENLDPDKESILMATEWKNPTIALILALFLGCWGIDRFWLGQPGLGVAKLLTCGGLGIWGLIDLCTSMGRAKAVNYNKLMLMF